MWNRIIPTINWCHRRGLPHSMYVCQMTSKWEMDVKSQLTSNMDVNKSFQTNTFHQFERVNSFIVYVPNVVWSAI